MISSRASFRKLVSPSAGVDPERNAVGDDVREDEDTVFKRDMCGRNGDIGDKGRDLGRVACDSEEVEEGGKKESSDSGTRLTVFPEEIVCAAGTCEIVSESAAGMSPSEAPLRMDGVRTSEVECGDAARLSPFDVSACTGM